MDAPQCGKRDGILQASVQPRRRARQSGGNLNAASAPIIVTAEFGAADFAWLDGLRRAHFPPERNQVPAHLTLFHHLSPSLEDELQRRLGTATQRVPAPWAEVVSLMSLGNGVALRIRSEGLASIRGDLADAFAGMLTPQDQAGWRPHVTIQNKVPAAEAKTLHEGLSSELRLPRAVAIVGLTSWRYLDGPWEVLRRHRFG